MKVSTTPRQPRISLLLLALLTAALPIAVLAAPQSASACGSFMGLSLEERGVLLAAEELALKDGAQWVMGAGTIEIKGDRATVPLEVLTKKGSRVRTYVLVRAGQGWVRE
jgi:hypothetical protein